MKKTTIHTLLAIMMATMTTACQKDDATESYTASYSNSDSSSGSSISSGTSTSSDDLLSFTVAIDSTSAEPASAATAYYPDAEEDSVSADNFTNVVTIVFSGNSASCSSLDGVTASISGAHVTVDHGSTKNVCYAVSGSTTAGSLTVAGDKKYALRLNGVSIANPDSSAINLVSKKRAYIALADGTTNTLKDGTASQADDQKAAFYCKGKMLFSGSGALRVYGQYKNAIACADYMVFGKGNNIYATSTANHGIKANDGIFINGGILNVEVSAAAAKGINCESNIVVNGGSTTVVTTGNGTYDSDEADTKAAAGIACDSVFTINGGELNVRSTGTGGKGIKADWEAFITGGTIHAITEGSQYRYSSSLTSSPKGIKVGTKNVHGLLNISGGTVMVRTSGTNGEGIESKGTVQVSAYDDAINSAGDMTVSGGSIVAVGKNSDGLDTNGNLYIKGGNIVAYGASGAETGIDVGEQYRLSVTGGSFFGIGGRIDATVGSTTQGIASTTGSVTANSTVTVNDGNTVLATFIMPPYAYNSGTIMVSAPGMVSGNSYTLTLGTSTQTLSASSSVSSGMGGAGGNQPGGGGMGGGGRPW